MLEACSRHAGQHALATGLVMAGSNNSHSERAVWCGQHDSDKVRGGADINGVEWTKVCHACGGVRTRAPLLSAGVDSMHHHYGTDRMRVTH
jgi:hypothetical protein